ncbi:hypothetical protein F7725_016476, partial [Dissostichus mawsoni]
MMMLQLQPEDGDPERPEAQKDQDLKSVLVTSVLNLEELDVDLYRGTHHWVPHSQRLFGGQIIGQALVAAAKSVSDNLYAHSLHCYFVRAGDPKVPVLYQVDRIREGRSFTVRSVRAIQHGQPILICQASFQMLQPSPLQHHKPDLAEKYKLGLNKLLANEVPIEIKPVNPPGNMKLHCCVAAYVSDFAFLGTALLPYPGYRAQFAASLDHAMWFHSTFRSDEWMLYECESPWA